MNGRYKPERLMFQKSHRAAQSNREDRRKWHRRMKRRADVAAKRLIDEELRYAEFYEQEEYFDETDNYAYEYEQEYEDYYSDCVDEHDREEYDDYYDPYYFDDYYMHDPYETETAAVCPHCGKDISDAAQ